MFIHQSIEWEEWNQISCKKEENIEFGLSLEFKNEEVKEGGLTVQNLVKNHFTGEEMIKDLNGGYFWNYWDKKVNKANLSFKLDSDVPPILMVTLNRFYFDKGQK